jgi:NAD-dependent SIR2 family protein deacetylase
MMGKGGDNPMETVKSFSANISDYNQRIEKARQKILEAKYILIGGGAGLSDAAGLHYIGKRFTDNFAPFIEKYGFTDLYTSSFYSFQTQEERWAYWAKHIAVNRYDEPATALYQEIYRLVQDKEYFVITTNVEHQFIKADFTEEKTFAVQGDYGFFQCERGCHNTLYCNKAQIKAMISQTHDSKIPTSLVPKCPICGGSMDVNLRHNNFFVEDENWHESKQRYTAFLENCMGKQVIYLELGVGFNTPGIIRVPFEQLTYQNAKATLIRINRDYPQGAKENAERTIAFTEDMAQVIQAFIYQDRKRAKPVSINKTIRR